MPCLKLEMSYHLSSFGDDSYLAKTTLNQTLDVRKLGVAGAGGRIYEGSLGVNSLLGTETTAVRSLGRVLDWPYY